VVAPYYRAKRLKSYYTDPAQPFGKRAQQLIREALAHHIANGFNFAPLTADNAKFIYALNVFYAGKRDNAWSQGLWPHQSTLTPKVALAGGRKFADYQITDMSSQLTLGTFCHENGHMVCDFPDLYQYKGTGLGAGNYCLMCYGGTGANATNPVHVGAYLKKEAGWGTAQPAQPGTLSAPAGTNQFIVHQRNATEYFIIENRQRSGRDAGLPSAGLAIWHVDESASNTNPVKHYECALIQADNRRDLELGRNYGDADDLFSSTTQPAFSGAWRNGNPAGLSITQISASSPTMTFRVT
jgi:M6 family metalloprotease-like protein